MYCELTMYDTPSGKLTMQVRDKEEADKIVAVVHEILLGDDNPSRFQYKEQWGHGNYESPFRTMKNVSIDDVVPTKTPRG